MSTTVILVDWKEHLTRFGPSGALPKSEKADLQEQLANTKKNLRDARISGHVQEVAKEELRAANLTLALRELDLEHLEAQVADSEKDPVAIARAKVAVEQAKVAVAEAKVAVAEAEKDPVAIARAKVAVEQAKVAVAEAKVAVAEAEKDPVAIARAKVAVAEERWLHAAEEDQSPLKDILDAARSHAVQAATAGKAPAGKEVFENLTAFESFLRAENFQPKAHNDRLSQPLCLTQPRIFDIAERQAPLVRLLDVWFERFQTLRGAGLAGSQSGGKSIIPHAVVPAAPGMGKSRFLDVAASTSKSNEKDWQCKLAALRDFQTPGGHLDTDREVFCDQLTTAVGVCATFNSMSDRNADFEHIPDPGQALATRLLWGHFCGGNRGSFTRFAGAMTSLSCGPPTLEQVVELLLADAGERHIILCVDELLLVDPWKERDAVSPSVNSLLTELATVLDLRPSLHVVVSSLSAVPVMEWRSSSGRKISWVGLPALSSAASLRMLISAAPGYAPGGMPSALMEQLNADCGGHPRLIENVASVLARRPNPPPYGGVLEFLFATPHVDALKSMSVADKWSIALGAKPDTVLQALSMALSARRYSPREISPLALSGLLLQSPILTEESESSPANIPALLLGIWFVHLEKHVDMTYPTTRIRQLLKSCYEFVHGDLLKEKRAAVGMRFATQVAHLLRIRLLLLALPTPRADTFALTQLLSIDGQVNRGRWWKDGAGPHYGLPEDPGWEVKVCSDQELQNLLLGPPPPAGAIYIAARDDFEGVDLFIHPPSGGAITFSVRWAAQQQHTSETLYRTPLADSINKTAQNHQNITPRITAYVKFAYQIPRNSAWRIAFDKHLWPECAQAVVVPREDVEKLIPECFKCRPCFSDRSYHVGNANIGDDET